MDGKKTDTSRKSRERLEKKVKGERKRVRKYGSTEVPEPLLGVWVAQVVEHQVEGLMVGSSTLPPDKEGENRGRKRNQRRPKKEEWD